jgi:hypothetical protein
MKHCPYWKFLLMYWPGFCLIHSLKMKKMLSSASQVFMCRVAWESQHTLWILSTWHLPANEDAYPLDWYKPMVFAYPSPLHQLSAHRIAYWLRSMNILALPPGESIGGWPKPGGLAKL